VSQTTTENKKNTSVAVGDVGEVSTEKPKKEGEKRKKRGVEFYDI